MFPPTGRAFHRRLVFCRDDIAIGEADRRALVLAAMLIGEIEALRHDLAPNGAPGNVHGAVRIVEHTRQTGSQKTAIEIVIGAIDRGFYGRPRNRKSENGNIVLGPIKIVGPAGPLAIIDPAKIRPAKVNTP